MDKLKIHEKIRKCLALAKSSNANEAAAAMRQAQKLMAAHGIGDDELVNVEILIGDAMTDTKNPTAWQAILCGVIARTFGIKVIRQRRKALPAPGVSAVGYSGRTLSFYGPGPRVELAEYAYACLSRALMKARREYLKAAPARRPRAAGNAFAVGFASECGKAVEPLVPSEAEREAFRRFEAAQGWIPGAPRDTRVSDRAGFAAGAAAGRSAEGLRVPTSGYAPRAAIAQ